MEILILSLLIAVILNIAIFIPAFILKTDKLTDFSYGFTFIIVSLIVMAYTGISAAKLVLFSMITLWGLRIAMFLLIRVVKTKKDARFDGIRESFLKFFSFWLLQGISVWVILIPSFLFFPSDATIGAMSITGISVWATGLAIETISDYQKFAFKNAGNKGWIETGLWKYSRHPNYFGEILCWIGIYVFTLGTLKGYNALIGLISPLYITILLLFVTGIPKLEKSYDERYGKDKKYVEYKRRTSLLIILPRKE